MSRCPVAVPGVRLADGAAASPTDRSYWLTALDSNCKTGWALKVMGHENTLTALVDDAIL